MSTINDGTSSAVPMPAAYCAELWEQLAHKEEALARAWVDRDAARKRAEDAEAEVGVLRVVVQNVADIGSREWAREHARNDHVCELDHKDEMAIAECVERAHAALVRDAWPRGGRR